MAITNKPSHMVELTEVLDGCYLLPMRLRQDSKSSISKKIPALKNKIHTPEFVTAEQ